MSRRAWLLLVILGLVVVASLLLFHFILRKVEADQLFEMEERLTSVSRTLSLAIADDLHRRDLEAVEEMLLSTHESELARLRVLDEQRLVVADTIRGSHDQEALRYRSEIQEAFAGRRGAYTRFADESERSLALFVAEPVVWDGRVIGCVYISRSTDAILQRLGELRRSFNGALLLLTAAIFAVALWLTRNLGHDLRRLSEVSELADFQPPARDQVERVSQSLHFLVESLRAKVAELEDERDKTRRFIEDIAHELKTPVTGLQGAVEGVMGSAPEHPLFANIARETDRLSRLTTLLLELRKLEYYQLRPKLFDLSSLIDTVLESFRAGSPERLREELPDHCPIEGDPAKIQRVLENLVENALRCAPDSTQVTVTLSTRTTEYESP